jgi:abnormal spindle-like microcephaly-associated protein
VLGQLTLIPPDVVTNLSKACRLRLVENGAIRIILALIKSCNRSKPHMEVLRLAVKIIENLAAHPETRRFVFEEPDMLDVLIELLQNYRDEHNVHTGAAHTLLLLSEEDEYAKVFRIVCVLPF